MIFEPFGSRLAKLRRQQNLSQDELAKAAELSRNYISLLEGNKREPSLNTLLKLRNALNVPLSNLIPEPPPTSNPHEEPDPSHPPDLADLILKMHHFTPDELAIVSRILDGVIELGRTRGKAAS
jgi:transcriptional regulator with XRE-family HTH domain